MPTSTKPGNTFTSTLTNGQSRPRVLAADDQQHVLDAIELLLRSQGYDVETARSPLVVRESLATASYDAVLIDLNYTRDTTSGGEGLDLLSEIVAVDSNTPVIVMTAWANVELAVEGCAGAHGISYRSRGRTSGYSRSFERRSSFIALCSRPSDCRHRIGCFAPRVGLNLSLLRRQCSQC